MFANVAAAYLYSDCIYVAVYLQQFAFVRETRFVFVLVLWFLWAL